MNFVEIRTWCWMFVSCCVPTATIATPAASTTAVSSSTSVSGESEEIDDFLRIRYFLKSCEFLRNSRISSIFPDTPVDELAAVVVAAGVAIVAVGTQQVNETLEFLGFPHTHQSTY